MNNTLTITHLTDLLAERTALTPEFCQLFISELFKSVTVGLKTSSEVTVKGLGRFILGDSGMIEFIPDTKLAELINEPFNAFEPIEIDASLADKVSEISTIEAENEFEELVEGGEEETSSELQSSDSADIVSSADTCNQQQAKNSIHEEVGINESKTVSQAADAAEHVEEIEISAALASFSTSEEIEDTAGETFNEAEVQEVSTKAEDTAIYIENEIEGNLPTDDEPTQISSTYDSHPRETQPIYIEPQLMTDKAKFWKGFALGIIVGLVFSGGIFFAILDLADSKKSVNYEEKATSQETLLPEEEPTLELPIDENLTAEVQSTTHEEQSPVITDTVRNNYYLASMARKHYNHYEYWVYIYEENKDLITDPDHVPLGTVLTIPELHKYGITEPDSPQSLARAKQKANDISRQKR